MKKLLQLPALIILCLFINLPTLYAQLDLDTKGFSFQGYARNSGGAALSDEDIEVKFTIYPSGGASEFEEIHTPVTTDAFGVFHLIIGSINTVDYKKLDFINSNNYKLKVETKIVGASIYATISDAEMQSAYAQAADNGVPVGSMIVFAGSKGNIPDGWMACDGTSVNSSTYPKLYAAIATSWGNGTDLGSGDFNLPDMRGVFARGVSEDISHDVNKTTRVAIHTGASAGNVAGSFQGSSFQDHGHSVDPPNAATTTEGSHNHDLYLGNGGGGGAVALGDDDDGIMAQVKDMPI